MSAQQKEHEEGKDKKMNILTIYIVNDASNVKTVSKYYFLKAAKGQLISKCPFGVLKSSKKNNEIFSRISALASKKRSNKKISIRESK